ncbi:MAG: class I SAM-dependent methyltransferase [Anaerolineales bacterium]|nr:class I SAM-dependent methyltransferase [Anaerolineales bacterium]
MTSEQSSASERFKFGENWQRFLTTLNEERVREAERSLQEMLGDGALKGKTFLDIGSGSGLFSLAAMRLGARQVHSFDFDPQSVACGQELKQRFYPQNDSWIVEPGSALDRDYLTKLGQWDVVYSWGVLHHTGNMWAALENVPSLVAEGGRLFVAVYNDQGVISKIWRVVKRLYNSHWLGRVLVLAAYVPLFVLVRFLLDVARGRNPLKYYQDYKKSRGMSAWYDWLDWLGGYPYEVASPEAIFKFFYARGFELQELVTRTKGCNEFVFLRKPRS